MIFDFADFKKIDARYKDAVYSVLVWGILSQGMGIFNKFSLHDDVLRYDVGYTFTSGRWMLEILAKIEIALFQDGHFSLPVFNGFLGLLFIAFSACVIIRLLEIKNTVICAFIGGLMACFPVITCLFGYMFTLHFYMIALFIGTIGTYFICRSGRAWLKAAGILLVGASAGIYQAFIPVTLTLMLLYLIRFAANTDDTKALVLKILLVGASCVLFMLVYFVASKLVLSYYHASLDTYKSIDKMGSSSFGEYIFRAIDAYSEFFLPDKTTGFYMYLGRIRIAYIIVVALCAILSAVQVVRVCKRNHLNAILLALLIALFPLSVNFIIIMVGKDETHSLMVYSQVLTFCLLFLLLENIRFKKPAVSRVLSAATTVVTVFVLIAYCRVDNKCYLKAALVQSETISYFTTLITQIKECDGYSDELPVVFLNDMQKKDLSLKPGDNGYLEGIPYLPYCWSVNDYINNYRWSKFMWQWCGYSPTKGNTDRVKDTEDVRNMPHYPASGSIKVVEGILVVNF